MQRTITLTSNQIVVLMMALQELETSAEANVHYMSFVDEDKTAIASYLDYVIMLEDCKQLKAEFSDIISHR